LILAVAIDTPLRRTFDYRAPAGAAPGSIHPGFRLWVPFGRRRVIGVVTESREHSSVPENKLKSAYNVVDREATFAPALLSLLQWSAEYYRHPIGEVIAAAMPTPLRQGAPLLAEETVWRLTAEGRECALEKIAKRAFKQRAAIEWLARTTEASAQELAQGADIGAETLRELESRGYVERGIRVADSADLAPTLTLPRGAGEEIKQKPQLNEAQSKAVEAICSSLGSFATWLLYGVTGSGKTEVYLNAIAQTLARGEQALVLVPEIALTPQLLARFRDRFDTPPAVIHSGLNDGERFAAWRRARSGAARVVIGTRSAVFVPLANPGLIVIDEEHDASFKQQEGFRYSARDLAIVRAQRLKIPVMLGSATPSLESLARAQRQPDTLLSLPQRAAEARPPQLSLIDLRKNATTQGIAMPALQAMRRHLDAGNQVLLFLNRRGYAPVLFCPECGWGARCTRCDAYLTVHRNASDLSCHHCGAQHRAIEQCPSCDASVKPVGQGTERIEETVERLFPDAPLARIDRDSIRRKGELEAALARIDSNEVRILVGTQMLTKGHHFPNVTLVVVLNADQGLFSVDFRASERLAQTIVQVAGRAGRAERAGEVLIQTEYPSHPLLTLLLQGGYQAFATGALTEREQTAWPPFARIALLRADATQAAAPMKFLHAAAALARGQATRDVRILGPATAPMERRAGRYRAQLLLHAATHSPVQRLMSEWIPALEALPEARQVRWSIDVDPVELS
jgi:primosomal protein N' (replication factor Y) (superfamily II helicase)